MSSAAMKQPNAGWWRALTVMTWVIASGVFTQAVLAGQAWFITPSLFALHGGVGHGVLLLAALTGTLAWLLRAAGPAILATVLVIALVAQTGLGYVGRRTGEALASSLHVPLGVAIFGGTIALAVLVTLRRSRGRGGRSGTDS